MVAGWRGQRLRPWRSDDWQKRGVEGLGAGSSLLRRARTVLDVCLFVGADGLGGRRARIARECKGERIYGVTVWYVRKTMSAGYINTLPCLHRDFIDAQMESFSAP